MNDVQFFNLPVEEQIAVIGQEAHKELSILLRLYSQAVDDQNDMCMDYYNQCIDKLFIDTGIIVSEPV